MPLEEIMIKGNLFSLIFFDCSGGEANVTPGQLRGEP